MAKKTSNKPPNSLKKTPQKQLKKEGNIYDKIFKENIERVFRPLVEERLGVKIVKATPLKEKMQTTIEREMDFFYHIETNTGEKFILHLEFESGINLKIVYRVGEYHGMSMRRYELPIRHLVIYLGEEPPTMRTQLKPEEIYSGFDLLNVQGLDTDELLSSQIPEVVLIAILSNYAKDEAETILRQVIINLKKLVKHKRTLKRYINQLMILSRLRKIEELTIKISEEMPMFIDIEKDALYLKGNQKGIERGIEQGIEQEAARKNYIFVSNLLNDTDYDNAKIARLADVTFDFVQKVRDEKPDYMSVSHLLLGEKRADDEIAVFANVSVEFVQKVRFILGQKK